MTVILIVAACFAETIRHHPVSIEPHRKDSHTLFLATFEVHNAVADFAAGDADLAPRNTSNVKGPYGRALHFNEDGRLAVSKEGNLLSKAGTIELVMRDTDQKRRHRFL
ncbi:MAG: hypothetical protein QF886_20400, partial [Planctomycetota bacterium]|nr:hypothetical protein [Planctomycetota bacterium]